MIEGLQPYPEYKESGLPWLRRCPKHWVIKRGKSYMTCVDQRSRSGKEELLTVSSSRGVVPRSSAKVTMFKAESYSGYKLCWPGDLVINSLWAWGGGLGVTHHHGIISTAYSVYRPRPSAKMNPRFLHELVRSSAFNWELQVRSKGIWISRLQLTDTSFLNAPIPLPPPDEQAAIVRFLDHANRKIDKFIRAKRKLIGLLTEQKQAIIHRAVTRGLNPDVKLKPSGIPWIGDIPQHWEVRRLKQCITRVEQGWSPQCDSQPASSEEWGVMKVGCVNQDFFNESQNKKLPSNFTPDSTLEIRDGDIMVSRANTRELLGLAALAENPRPKLILCDKLFRFRARSVCFLPKFLVMLLRSQASRSQIESSTNGASSSMQNIGQPVIKNLWLSMPPVDEQAAIVAHVGRETASLTAAIARAEREIALMQEYRTRLTADVVTGKLDVRAAATQLPDMTDDADGAATGEADALLEDSDAEDTEE
jgi:type I restriction enzyme, S subunit